jgi:hypothetical protein
MTLQEFRQIAVPIGKNFLRPLGICVAGMVFKQFVKTLGIMRAHIVFK